MLSERERILDAAVRAVRERGPWAVWAYWENKGRGWWHMHPMPVTEHAIKAEYARRCA